MNLRSSIRLVSPIALTLTLAYGLPAALTEAGLGALPGAESVSLAQGTPPANDAVTEIARQRYQEGVKDFDAGKWEEARGAFLQAYALKRSPAILLNLGLSELRAGKYYEDAGNHLQQFLRETPGASPDQRATAEKSLVEVKRHSGLLVVVIDANGADVSLDGATVGKSPLTDPVFVKPGKHTVFAVYQGKSSASVVEAKTGAIVAATLTLGVAGAPAPAVVAPPITPPTAPSIAPPGSGLPPGMMGPGTPPVTPPPVTPPPTGPGVPPAAYPPGGYPPGGYPPGGYPPGGNVGPGGMPMVTPDGEREPLLTWYKRKPIAWVGTGVAGLGLLGGIIFSASAGSASSSATSAAAAIATERKRIADSADPAVKAFNPDGRANVCGDRSTGAGALTHFADACTNLRGNESSYHTDVALAVTSWVLFGVGVAGTTAYTMLDWYPSKGAPKTATTGPKILAVAPVISPALQGVTVVGSF
ncbi:MAG: hypothetical protein ABJE95_14985 [Byssovorax sp.]